MASRLAGSKESHTVENSKIVSDSIDRKESAISSGHMSYKPQFSILLSHFDWRTYFNEMLIEPRSSFKVRQIELHSVSNAIERLKLLFNSEKFINPI